MALRKILTYGDELLEKKCRTVEKIDRRIICLLDDMAETLHASGGVGLAAPQVGVLKRIAVIDVGDGIIELINPEIIEEYGCVNELEGCLSLPGKWGYVERPEKVTVAATNRNGEKITVTGEGLLARAICHETEHLDGILFVTHVTEFVNPDEEAEQ